MKSITLAEAIELVDEIECSGFHSLPLGCIRPFCFLKASLMSASAVSGLASLTAEHDSILIYCSMTNMGVEETEYELETVKKEMHKLLHSVQIEVEPNLYNFYFERGNE